MQDEEDAVREGVRALTQFFVDEGTLGDTLHRVSELACAITPATYAGITMIVEGRPSTGVFTHADAPEIDATQYRSGEGPCMYASTLSLPLAARGRPLGALNLYAKTPASFTDTHEESATLFAGQASIALANAQVYWDSRQLGENLTQAIESRETIGRAVGILMAVGGRSPDAAFGMLASASQRENRKVRDIAEEIVERTVGRGNGGPT